MLIGLRPGSYVPIFRWLEREPHDDKQETGATIESRRASIAVLPFVNMSPEPEQDYFCDGISEEIIDTLTRVSGLNVIARTSAFQFKGVAVDIREVGQRLGADLVIEGSVRKRECSCELLHKRFTPNPAITFGLRRSGGN